MTSNPTPPCCSRGFSTEEGAEEGGDGEGRGGGSVEGGEGGGRGEAISGGPGYSGRHAAAKCTLTNHDRGKGFYTFANLNKSTRYSTLGQTEFR